MIQQLRGGTVHMQASPQQYPLAEAAIIVQSQRECYMMQHRSNTLAGCLY